MPQVDEKALRALRQSLKRKRQQLSAAEVDRAARNIQRHLFSIPELKRCETIGSYISVKGEADPGLFAEKAMQRKKRIFLPVLRKNEMRFYELKSGSSLQINRFGIPEPAPARAHFSAASHLNAILVPLVAFDPKGNRLGMGGGYYDRTLQLMKHRSKFRRPLLIGVAYDFQQVDVLQTQSWDIPLHMVITDTQVHRY